MNAFPLRGNSRRDKKVQFSTDKNILYRVQSALDLVEHADIVWYSKEEYKEIRSDIVETVRKLKSGEPEELPEFCYRGLEYKLPKNTEKRRYNLGRSEHIVWVCQNERTDADVLARRYSDHARQCQRDAHVMGVVDAKEAQLDDCTPVTTAAEMRKDLAPTMPRRTWAAAC